MTDDQIKDLVSRLRIIGPTLPNDKGYSTTVPQAVAIAADTLEALAGEVERLTTNGVHTCHDQCQRPLCKLYREIVAAKKHGELLNKMLGEAEAERDRLKAALETIAYDNVPREVFIVWRTDGSNSKHDKCQHMRVMYDDCGNCTALFARKALGDAS